jgi:hypothetical protein
VKPFAPFSAVVVGACLTACGGSNAAAPPPTTVFDPSGSTANPAPVDVTTNAAVERPYPALDGAGADANRWTGVSVLNGAVRFTRPANWNIRDAGMDAGHAFIRYVSPESFSFAIYERAESADASWKDIEEHYEADVAANGAKALGQRVPMATGSNQGRAYTIDRKIESKDPVLSRSREILLRGAHHVVLIQVVTTETSLARLAGELLEVFLHLEVD